MEVTLDTLSFVLLALILLATLIHLVLLRKPEPAIHPLLLGRQSDLARVRKPNESPAFVSASAGLGGVAKQALHGIRSMQELWTARQARIALGSPTEPPTEVSLDTRVQSLQHVLAGKVDDGLVVKIDDPTDAFLTILAANSLLSGSSSPPILVSPTVDFPSTVPAAIAISSVEVPAFLDKTPTTAATPPGNLIVINPGKAPSKDKSNGGRIDLLKGWKVHQVFTAELGDASTTALTPNTSSDAAMQQVCLRVVTNVNSAGVTADITNKNLINGGVLSLLSMLPADHRLTSDDRILSFEHPSTPWGLTVALSAAAVGATLGLCSPTRGIVSRCRSFNPSVIFCSPNELNAIRVALASQFPAAHVKNPSSSVASGGVVVPMAHALKRSLLRSGNVSKSTFWDRLIFSKVRSNVVGPDLRLIVCSAEEGAAPAEEVVDFLRIVLGIPIMVTLTHPLVAGPISNTLFHDFQSFQNPTPLSSSLDQAGGDGQRSNAMHVGSPCTAMECKLVGLNEDDAVSGLYRGELVVKGPSVIRSITACVSGRTVESLTTSDGWTRTGITTELLTNGTLKVVRPL